MSFCKTPQSPGFFSDSLATMPFPPSLLEYDRSQQAVTKQANTAENQWSRSDQERIQNQAHIARAQEQLQNVLPDNQIINTLLDFDEYVNEFLTNGDKWNKPAGLSNMITKAKNVTEQSAFEKIMFLNMSNQVNDS